MERHVVDICLLEDCFVNDYRRSFILDYDGDLYDHKVRVVFHHFIRPEKKFENTEELRAQILRDANTTREYFANA